MPDGDVDEKAINFATAEFRRAAGTRVQPPGTPAATADVRARLRQRAALLGALVLLLVASSVGGVLLTWRSHRPAGTTTGATPTVSASGTSSPAPSPNPSLNQLNQVTLPVPAWSPEDGADACPGGSLTFVGGRYGSAGNPLQASVRIVTVTALDLPDGGMPVQVATLRCEVGATGPQQVVAYRLRDAGGYDLLGQVLRTSSDVQDILAVARTGPGVVDLTVGNVRLCCGQPGARQLTQRRTYSWTGGAFTQTSGPDTFRATGVRFTAQLTYGPIVALATAPSASATPSPSGTPSPTGSPATTWVRTGTLRIRVSNDSAGTPDLAVFLALTMQRGDGGMWSQCATMAATSGTVASCRITPALTQGSFTTLILSVRWAVTGPDDPAVPGADGGVVQVRTGDRSYGELPVLVSAG